MLSWPTGPTLLKNLKNWRDLHRLTYKEVHTLYVERCKIYRIKPTAYTTFCAWLQNEGKSFGYSHIRPIFEAHSIGDKHIDLDLFIDDCQEVTLDDVVKGKSGGWDQIGPIRGFELNAEEMKNNRTRLDILIFQKGQDTHWKSHKGHEFVYVISGGITSWFRLGPRDEPRQETLAKGDGIVFPSKIWHRFKNEGKTAVTLAVARPTWSNRNQG